MIYQVLIEIREATSPDNPIDNDIRKKIFYLSDLVHSAPVALAADEHQGGDGSAVLEMISQRARDRGIERWLENAIAQE
ncbi:MAG: hypothetical protein ACRDNZ_24475 [Streptosporangiaceae bacterium]